MANDPGFSVEGLREVRKKLTSLKDKVGTDMLRDAHEDLAARVRDLALPHVPVGVTGNLKKSVRGLGTVAAATGKAGGARVPYAAAVHWGTGPRRGQKGPHNIERRPFLWNAIEKLRRSGATEEFEEQLEKVLDRLTRGR
jgi:hypothetical protein